MSGQAAVAPGTLTTSSVVNAGLITFNHTAANYVFSASITGATTASADEAAVRVLVTGAHGFVGGHLLELLCAEHPDVEVFAPCALGGALDEQLVQKLSGVQNAAKVRDATYE